MNNNSWQRVADFFEDIEDYSHQKTGITPEDFWPTVSLWQTQGKVHVTSHAIHILKKPLSEKRLSLIDQDHY